jgi:S-adenosylmethionine:tRNA ribosyltransferase-isomerase
MKTAPYSLHDFDFDLPERLIAQEPARPRDSARLLEIGETLADRSIRDLPERLETGDLLVVNDTKVIPARLFGQRGSVAIEVTLHKPMGDTGGGMRWRCFAKPGRRLRIGDRVDFAADFHAEVLEKLDGGEVVLSFESTDFDRDLKQHGAMPLPPYIQRLPKPTDSDFDDYQTVYAENDGAVAAPTAGLHFTPRLFEALAARGIDRATVTLHVGAGTFLPVRSDDPDKHVMHAEWGEIAAETAEKINRTRRNGGRIVAVGTTSLRLLESAADQDGTVRPFRGDTDLFILPGYRFKAVDLMLTNFHLPRSTLFMLVTAFAGLERMQAAYAHAVAAGYRFYSYGDACLLHRAE